MKLLFTLRSIFATLVFVIVTVLLSASAIFVSFFTEPNARFYRLHIKWWGLITCFIYGVNVQVKNKEKWPKETGGVVLFNHTSFFDIFAMVGFLPDMRFGAKIQLFKIPIFGAAMKRAGILPIDRERREKVFEVYQKSIDRLTAGEKIALAPEGTRTTNPQVLSNFKAGPFVFALQSKVQVIPVVIKGAYEVLPKGQIFPNTSDWKAEISVTVLDPIATEPFLPNNRSELQAQVKKVMQAELDRKAEVSL